MVEYRIIHGNLRVVLENIQRLRTIDYGTCPECGERQEGGVFGLVCRFCVDHVSVTTIRVEISVVQEQDDTWTAVADVNKSPVEAARGFPSKEMAVDRIAANLYQPIKKAGA